MDAFNQLQVIPDALDAAPQHVLQFNWAGADIAPGAKVTPTQSASPPTLSWPTEDGAIYTVVMFGLDAPSREDRSQAEICLWCITNVPGTDIGKGEVLAQYVQLCPSKGSGEHRFVALVYKQSGPVEASEKPLVATSVEGRARRSLRRLSAAWGLGTPVAGTCFTSQYDASVDAYVAALDGSW